MINSALLIVSIISVFATIWLQFELKPSDFKNTWVLYSLRLFLLLVTGFAVILMADSMWDLIVSTSN